ncbi:MAG: AMP-binding protein [Pseudomonadales bacterium]|nr:AMP-binding protein [Pseudomonadales bacterium]
MKQILSQLEYHALHTPDQPAIISGETIISYRELAARVQTMAEHFSQSGCQTLAFQFDNGVDWIVTDLAGAAAEMDIVPIPGFFTPQQLNHVISDAAIDLYGTTDQVAPGAGWLTHPSPEAVSPAFFYRLAEKPGKSGSPLQTKITYTSGSTGNPKGVMLSGTTIDTVAQSIVTAMSSLEISKHLCLLPMATLLENVAGVYAPLLRGITIECPSLNDIGLSGASLDIEKFCAVINNAEADSIILVPQLLTALVTLAEFGLLNTNSLKMIAVGGGRISQHLLDRADKLGLPVFQGYGLSECCSVLTLNTPLANRPGSVGKPLPHAEIRVSDTGELEARGSTMVGYLGGTANNTDWYATGDLGYIDAEGYVYITGRRKNVFITSFGRNVNPEWVESALTQQAAVSQALIFGEAQAHNLALLWLRFEQTPEQLAEMIALTNQELPDYAQVHQYIVMSDPIDPALITANGRIKRQETIGTYLDVIEQHFAHGEAKHAVL